MFVTELLRAMLKFWYLLLCGMILAGVGGYYVWNHTEPRYTSEASVLLLPPVSSLKGTAPTGDDSNPLMNLGGLNQARDVLISAMSSAAQKEVFHAEYPHTAFSVGVDPLSSGPILVIKTDSESAHEASAGIEALMAQTGDRLSKMQGDLAVPDKSVITSLQLTPPTAPEPDTKPQLRAAAMTGAGIVVVTILLIAAIDGLIRFARKARRRARDGDVEEVPDVAPPGDEHSVGKEFDSYDADDFEALRDRDESLRRRRMPESALGTGAR